MLAPAPPQSPPCAPSPRFFPPTTPRHRHPLLLHRHNVVTMTEEHPEQQEDVKPKINLMVDFEGQSQYPFSRVERRSTTRRTRRIHLLRCGCILGI